MEDRTAQDNIDLLVSNLDTILVGTAVPFAVQNLLNNYNQVTVLISVAYFLSLLNFFHAKFNLTLFRAFGEFASEAPVMLNFLNSTLHIILIGSFVFMGFFVHQPGPFIVANLVMRVCDLIMDIALLLVINRLNLPLKTQRDLKRLHINWTRGTIVFTLFFTLSFYLLINNVISNYYFALGFLFLEVIDIITDYYLNRKFYFGSQPTSKVSLLVNSNSTQYKQVCKLVSVIDEKLRKEIRRWLKDTTDGSELPDSWDKIWCVEESGEVKGFLGTQLLPWSKAMLVKCLVIKEPKSWIRYAKLLFENSLIIGSKVTVSGLQKGEQPIGIIINLQEMQEQTFQQLRADLGTFLWQIGFQSMCLENKDYYFLSSTTSNEIIPELEALIISSLKEAQLL